MSHNNNMDLLTEMYSSGSEPELRDIGRESPNPERFISKLSAVSKSTNFDKLLHAELVVGNFC